MVGVCWSVDNCKDIGKRLMNYQVRIRTYEGDDGGPLVCVDNKGENRDTCEGDELTGENKNL
jgi:hypothetical protein